jgi:hypothetical protein
VYSILNCSNPDHQASPSELASRISTARRKSKISLIPVQYTHNEIPKYLLVHTHEDLPVFSTTQQAKVGWEREEKGEEKEQFGAFSLVPQQPNEDR